MVAYKHSPSLLLEETALPSQVKVLLPKSKTPPTALVLIPSVYGLSHSQAIQGFVYLPPPTFFLCLSRPQRAVYLPCQCNGNEIICV